MIAKDVEIHRSMMELAEFCTITTLTAVGKLPEYISQKEAYRLFGESTVKSWVRMGIAHKLKDGERNSRVRYSRIELEALNRSNNRLFHFLRYAKSEEISD